MNRHLSLICLLFGVLISVSVWADNDISDVYDQDSLLRRLESGHSFGIYKENYFVTGINRFKKFSNTNCNVKYQISVQQRLTRSILPLKTYLFMTYSQKSMWNIYQKSCPFEDNNYNPSIGLGKYIIRDNKLVAQMSLMIEHESNGRAGRPSRSWNRLTFHAMFSLTKNSNIQFKSWIPQLGSSDNPDFLKYSGLGYVTYNFRTPKKNFVFALSLMKRGVFNWDCNTKFEASYKIPFLLNQYIFLQIYSGYAECMLTYKTYRHAVRLGLSIKPPFFSLY